MNHIEKLRALLSQGDADALLLTSPVNQLYAVSYPFRNGYVLITGRDAYLITDFRYEEAATVEVGMEIRVVAPGKMTEFLADIFASEGVRRLGYEDTAMTCAALEALSRVLSFVPVPFGAKIETLRAVKDEEELRLIQSAQAITDRAYTHILQVLHPEMTEVEVALELEFYMRKNGAARASFPIIAVSGAASALPHGVGRERRLERGFLTMDFGAIVSGYRSDMTRTVCLGRATPEMKDIYNTVLQAQKLGIGVIRAGVHGRAPDAAARTYIDGAGYAGCFGHGFGHGVGLEIHESPRLSQHADGVLAAGNVVTAEPGIYLRGQCGCRIENMGVVTEAGFEKFTESSTELLELF